ncbi:MAG: hypothetical protein FWF82_04595 [Oscillospiraceae bacterium]|nr:hypothetical protein [Oscillospiraceae bacterium]
MAYETKTVYASVYDILETSKDLEEAKRRVAKIANVEGVILNSDKIEIVAVFGALKALHDTKQYDKLGEVINDVLLEAN